MKNSVFFGNGFNRLSEGSKSWSDLLESIADGKVINGITNTLQYEDLYLCDKIDVTKLPSSMSGYSQEYKVKYKIAKLVSDFKTNDAFEFLVNLGVDAYITTNYDETLEMQAKLGGWKKYWAEFDISERLYSIRRKHVYVSSKRNKKMTIWPIHGEAGYPQSIMLGYDHYCGAIGKIDSYLKGFYEYKNKVKDLVEVESMVERLRSNDIQIHSWIDLFFTTNVHIIGFGLDYSEQDIWWILNKRKRYMYENKGNIRNKIHFYGVVNESLEMLLNDFSVVVHKYSAPKSHSIKAWRKLYTEMLQDLKNNL